MNCMHPILQYPALQDAAPVAPAIRISDFALERFDWRGRATTTYRERMLNTH